MFRSTIKLKIFLLKNKRACTTIREKRVHTFFKPQDLLDNLIISVFVDTDGEECASANFAFGGLTTINRQFNIRVNSAYILCYL